jgi:hypothetical protein
LIEEIGERKGSSNMQVLFGKCMFSSIGAYFSHLVLNFKSSVFFAGQKDGSKLYPSIVFKTLSSPRVLLFKSKLHRNASVMERISIVAEAADRMPNRSKGKGSLEGLPLDFWDFVPSENKQVQSNMTKIILSPYQVMFFFSYPSLVEAVPCWFPVYRYTNSLFLP